MKKVLHWLDKHIEECLMCVFLLGIVVFMSIHVFCRYVLKSPLVWTEELTRYCFIWFVFSGVSYGLRHRTHIRVNIIEVFFPKVTPIFGWIQDIVATVFVIYLIPAIFGVVSFVAEQGQVSAGLHLPMQYVYGALGAGLLLGVVRIAQNYYDRFKAIADKKKEGKNV